LRQRVEGGLEGRGGLRDLGLVLRDRVTAPCARGAELVVRIQLRLEADEILARREGLLALENEAAALDDEFMRKGIQLVIDGRDTEIIRKVLETEVSNTQEKGSKSEAVFNSLGGYSPTLGIIGTVLGLIGMLKGLSEMGSSTNVAGTIGVATAQAFVATFYGIMFANLLWLPIASKIKERNGQLLLLREIMIEGILAIQAGDNPRLLEEKLLAFLDPKEREMEVEEGGSVAAEPGFSGSGA